MAEATQRGIAALKSGDRAAARRLLSAAIKENPNDALAWLWLSGAVEKDEERLTCLRHVLRIEPNNAVAQRGITQLLERHPEKSPAATQQTPTSPAEKEPDVLVGQPSEKAVNPAPDTASINSKSSFNETTWVTAQSAADSIASAVYELREELTPVEEEATPPSAASISTGPPTTMPPVARTAARRTGAHHFISAMSAQDLGGRMVFRTRPSMVPPLIAFWVFFFGAVAAGNILRKADAMAGIIFGLSIGFFLELVIVYIAIRNFRTPYELTANQLSLPYQGQRVFIPISLIFHAECRQNFLQRLVGLGNIYLDAAVKGELTQIRMRDVPQCEVRTQQILYLVKNLA